MKLIKDCIVRVVEDPQKAAAMMDDGWEKLGEPKKAKRTRRAERRKKTRRLPRRRNKAWKGRR